MSTLRFPSKQVNPPAFVITCLAATCMALAAWNGSALAEDWPSFRGPGQEGISSETGWSAEGDPKIAWKAQVGLGHASFVIADGRVITTGHNGKDTDTVYCFDAASGKALWSHSYPHPLDDLYYPGGTTGTPTIDGDVVYHVARRGHLLCLDAASGAVKWSKHLMDDLGYDMPTWGFTGSPLVDGGRLLLTAGDAGLSLNKQDGSVIWQSKNGEAGYSTPYRLDRGGKELVIFSNKRGYVCVETATGAELWRVKWLTRYGVNAAVPIVNGNDLFISSGYGKGATLLRFADGEAATAPEEVWKNREFATQMNAAMLIDGYLYGIHGNEGQDGTGLRCLHLESGDSTWTDTLIGHGATIVADGQLIVLSEKGELLIGPVSTDGFAPSLRKQLVGEKCWTVPVLANGLLYCRSDKGEIAVVDLRK